jgi:hypothetical protein
MTPGDDETTPGAPFGFLTFHFGFTLPPSLRKRFDFSIARRYLADCADLNDQLAGAL